MISPPNQSPELPAEIIHKILDDVGDDKLPLLSVALLSRVWRDCSRPRVFRDIIFKDGASLLQFSKLYLSQHCSFPKAFRQVVLRLKIQANMLTSVKDRLRIAATLSSISARDTFELFAGKTPPPPWISWPTRNWTSIGSLKIVGGKHCATHFFQYLKSFPKLESLHLEGICFSPQFERVAEPQYLLPTTVTKLTLNIRPRPAEFFRECVIKNGGLSKVVNLEIWIKAKSIRNEGDARWDALTKAFRTRRLRHIEHITIHQLPQAHSTGSRGLHDELSNMSTLSLHNVDELRSLTLDYSKADAPSVDAVLPGHMRALKFSKRLETLEIILPAYARDSVDLLADFLEEVDREMESSIVHRPDRESMHALEVIVRGLEIDESDIHDCLHIMMPFVEGSIHSITSRRL